MKLSKKSRDLMLFFEKNKHLNYNKQTNKTNFILSELYNKINEAYNYCKNMHYRTSIKKIMTSSQITKPLNFGSNSFPEIIIKHIDESMTTEITYSFSLHSYTY